MKFGGEFAANGHGDELEPVAVGVAVAVVERERHAAGTQRLRLRVEAEAVRDEVQARARGLLFPRKELLQLVRLALGLRHRPDEIARGHVPVNATFEREVFLEQAQHAGQPFVAAPRAGYAEDELALAGEPVQ